MRMRSPGSIPVGLYDHLQTPPGLQHPRLSKETVGRISLQLFHTDSLNPVYSLLKQEGPLPQLLPSPGQMTVTIESFFFCQDCKSFPKCGLGRRVMISVVPP